MLNDTERTKLIADSAKKMKHIEFLNQLSEQLKNKYGLAYLRIYFSDDKNIILETSGKETVDLINSVIVEVLPLIEKETEEKYKRSNVSPVYTGHMPNAGNQTAIYCLYKQ